MANKRMIAGDIFEDDFIGSLSLFERLLWVGLITSVADDQGRMMDNPALIRTKVFLYDTIQDSEVEAALTKVCAAGKIARYVAGGKHLLQIVNWWKYQSPAWASPSKFPAPTDWVDRIKYHTVGNKVICVNWDKVGGYIDGYVPPLHRPIEERRGEERRGEESPGEEPPLADRPEVFDLYESEIGLLTPMVADALIDAEKTYPPEWFKAAFQEAVAHNARSWKYVETVLSRWKRDGFKSTNGKPIGRGQLSDDDRLALQQRALYGS